MSDDPELIELDEAVQILLAASAPELVGKVTLDWLQQNQWVDDELTAGPDRKRLLPARSFNEVVHLAGQVKAGFDVVTVLKGYVRDCKIRMWGRWRGKGGRIAVEVNHQLCGDLDVWGATFKGAFGGYTEVRLVRSDVQRIAEDEPSTIETAVAFIEHELSVNTAVAGKRLIEAWISEEVGIWFQRAGLRKAWYTKPFPLKVLGEATIYKDRLIDSHGADCERGRWVIRTSLTQLRNWLKKLIVESAPNTEEIASHRAQRKKKEKRENVSALDALSNAKRKSVMPTQPFPQPSGRRGPSPAKSEAVLAEMQAEIAGGSLTLAALASMKEVAMAAKYGVSRETARNARKKVLSPPSD